MADAIWKVVWALEAPQNVNVTPKLCGKANLNVHVTPTDTEIPGEYWGYGDTGDTGIPGIRGYRDVERKCIECVSGFMSCRCLRHEGKGEKGEKGEKCFALAAGKGKRGKGETSINGENVNAIAIERITSRKTDAMLTCRCLHGM